ncbi:MAG TPA: efflux RND transporter periplasmic adaptor subunit [Dongiaceae bacterium]|nr:efflux RND transporter periplasmic adaptor subunit [Dongiaceae bacterium]
MKTKSKKAGLNAATLGLLIATGCQRADMKATSPPPEFERQGNQIILPEQSSLRLRLTFETARAEQIQTQLSAPAVVEADPQRFANVFPPLTGRLVKLHVQLGDAVTNGQLLASLSSPDFFAAQNDYLKARSAVRLTSRALKRQQELLEHKIAAQKDVEQATSDYESARSDLDSVTQRLSTFGFNPGTDKPGQPLQVLSPAAGRVVEMTSAHGQFRNDVTAPLLTVADLSTVWLTASVPEKDLRYLAKDQSISASLAAYPGEAFSGQVLLIGDLLDPDLRVAKVRIAFANPQGRLKPGMFGTVNFLGFPQMQITVPSTAIVQAGQSSFVFEQVKPWTLQPRQVAVGAHQGERIVITRGVEAGASILVKEGVLFQ